MPTLITGAHAILYSRDPDADRAFLRDVLELSHVDVGDGWLIFALPPAELAVHPSSMGDRQELYLTCADIRTFVADMQAHGVPCESLQELEWGKLTRITLPGGGTLGVYEPLHARPKAVREHSPRKAS